MSTLPFQIIIPTAVFEEQGQSPCSSWSVSCRRLFIKKSNTVTELC